MFEEGSMNEKELSESDICAKYITLLAINTFGAGADAFGRPPDRENRPSKLDSVMERAVSKLFMRALHLRQPTVCSVGHNVLDERQRCWQIQA